MMLMGRGMFSNHERLVMDCQKNLQKIYLAMSIYEIDHKGSYPVVMDASTSEAPLSLLVPRSTAMTEIFICPASNENKLPEGEPFAKRKISYAYYMGRSKSDGADALLLTDRQINTLPKIKRQQMFSEDGNGPGANHAKAGGNLLFCDGSFRMAKPRVAHDYLFPTNVILLNPKP